VLAAAVETVRVLVTAAVPETLGAAGEREQPGVSLTLVMLVVTAQIRFTVPVKPPEGVRLIVEVLPLVAPAATRMLPLLLRVNAEGPVNRTSVEASMPKSVELGSTTLSVSR
jgi:hypothetical protein